MTASLIGKSKLDNVICTFAGLDDGDLVLCESNGVAYQKDMSAGRVPYDSGYLEKVSAYEDSEIAQRVNSGRCAVLMRHLSEGMSILDVGAGSGAFIRAAQSWGLDVKGFDVIPEAVEQLKAAGLYADELHKFGAVTMWDSIEHMEDPAQALGQIARGSFLFVSVPVFYDLKKIRNSKHYRPGEHLYYWTTTGFVDWMKEYGFSLLEFSYHEISAGRDSIGAFAFIRDYRI